MIPKRSVQGSFVPVFQHDCGPPGTGNKKAAFITT